MPQNKFPVYIPAGSNPSDTDDPLLVKTNATNKALIELNGKKIIEYVLEAVDQSKYVDRIFIVGITQDDIDYQADHPIEFIPSKGSRMDTLDNWMAYLEDAYNGELPNHVLSFSADIPLIEAYMIDEIVENLQEEYNSRFEEIELYYPLIPKDTVLEKYPNANKRFRKFTEGKFATGDFLIFSPRALRNEKTRDVTKKILESRKHMMRLLLKFDILAPIKYLFGKLSARNDIFPFMKEYIDVTVELMITNYPEICLDLDYPEDFDEIQQLVKEKNQ